MKLFYFLAGLLMMQSGIAAVEFPSACKGMPGIKRQWVINADKPSLYLVHNFSSQDIWLTHTPERPSASAGWSSRLSAGKWSAILMKHKNFAFDCTESRPGHEQRTTCGDVIAVCQQQATIKPGDGGYWVAEDLELKPLLSSIERRGIELPNR